MTLALVVATTMTPVASHAKTHDSAKVAQTEAPADHDCHGHGAAKAASEKTTQNDKDKSDKCCDKGVCKCVGGTCHNGLSKIFSNSGDMLVAFAYSQSRFDSTNEFADSALLEGLKRPPRA